MELTVVGFLFNSKNEVALILKKHPKWQAESLNGVGGHVEAREWPIDAMRREFKEETGILIENWVEYADIRLNFGLVYCYYTLTDKNLLFLKDEEQVQWIPVQEFISDRIMSNVTSLVNVPSLLLLALLHKQSTGIPYQQFNYAHLDYRRTENGR